MHKILLVTAVAMSAISAQDGRELFVRHCAVCHGNGYGTERGPNLASRRVRSQPVEALRGSIRNGVPAAGMPAFNLPAPELDAITGFVRSLGASASESKIGGDRAAGEKYFFGKGGCANCHMVMGRGKASAPDLSSTGREMTLEELEEAVRNPSAKVKPGYSVVNVRLRDGRSLRGFSRNRNRYNAQIQDFDGNFHLLSSREISEFQETPGSLMTAPQCSASECRDVIAFLGSLTGAEAGKAAAPLRGERGLPFSRIANPTPGDWPSYHGNLSGNRHSPLTQISTANVKDLALQWVFPVNHFVLEVTPLAAGGVLYFSGPNQVFAIDGRSGRTIWHYQRPRGAGVLGDPAKGTNRGLALLGDRIFVVTDNARLLALHRVTGAVLWETDLIAGLDPKNYGNTSAPLVAGPDTIVAGIAGGDLGMRGFLSAFKASTGERVWRFWTVPAPGEPLADGWKGTALAKFGGGGGTWMTGTFDPASNIVYWGVGNPYPALDGDERKGDNLYTDSVLALDASSGKLNWHYQFTPHDLWDWDGGQTSLLLDRTYKGRDRKLLLNANRNGFFYVFDRISGELLLAEKFSDRVTWASGIGRDGRPILLPGNEPARDGTKVCPNILGAANWPSVAVNPVTGWFYVQSRDACGIYMKQGGWSPRPIPLEPGRAVLRALDIETGKRAWELPQIGPADSWGGVLSTAGGLVFFGEDSGVLAAADAKTGNDLWHIQTNASTALGDGHSWRASPMTYMAGGKQYVAVAAGPNILAFGLPDGR
jgi:PQQ-dependent dehydrogenase (methanol/ethanol family)